MRRRDRGLPDENSKRELGLYLALASCYFGLYALFLTVVPSWASRYGVGSVQAGVLVAVIAATGLIGDTMVARVSARYGRRRVILAGIGIASAASVLLATAFGFVMFVIATVFLGLALSMMMSPILSGLSSRAGEDQVSAQSTNAGWQRFGALVTSLFLLNVLSGSSKLLVLISMTLLIAALLVLALLLTPADGRLRSVAEAAPPPSVGIVRLIGRSQHLRAGLVSNATTGLLVIVGASFYPLVLVQLHKPDLLTAGLVARELLAVGAALIVRRLLTRRALGRFWMVAVVVGAVGLVTFPLVDSDALLVLAFSLHGTAVGLGIVLGNVMIYDGTSRETRSHGFAASAMVGRVATIVFPIVLGVTLGVSTGLAMATVAVIVTAAVVLYQALIRQLREAA